MAMPRGFSYEQSDGRRKSCHSTQRSESRAYPRLATTDGVAPRLDVISMINQAARESSPLVCGEFQGSCRVNGALCSHFLLFRIQADDFGTFPVSGFA